MHTTTITFRAAAAVLLALAVLATGCDRGGPGRYEISGEVTYQGQPVPGGRILFAPDGAQSNTGPGAVAEIRNGRYRTRRGLGAVDGPHLVTIYGTDGTPATEQRDNALFPEYQTTVDLPPGNATLDFDVPERGVGSWELEDGRWEMGDGERGMGNGEGYWVLGTGYRVLSTESAIRTDRLERHTVLQSRRTDDAHPLEPLFSAILLTCLAAVATAAELPTLWDPRQPLSNSDDIPVLEGVEFRVVKPFEFETDGYRFLHGVAPGLERAEEPGRCARLGCVRPLERGDQLRTGLLLASQDRRTVRRPKWTGGRTAGIARMGYPGRPVEATFPLSA